MKEKTLNDDSSRFSKKFVAYFFFSKWYLVSFGVSIDLKSPNIEIHLPFGFIRIGWEDFLLRSDNYDYDINKKDIDRKIFGYMPKGYF